MALTIDDFANVQSALWRARHKWFIIGVQLHLRLADLEAVDCEPGLDLEGKFRIMVTSWLRRGQRCTWRALREALEHPTVDLPELAQQIKTEYGSDESGDDSAVHDASTYVTSKESTTSAIWKENSEQQRVSTHSLPGRRLHLMLYKDSQKMAAMFSMLTTKTEDFLNKENIPVERLVTCISPSYDDTYKSVPLIADQLDTAHSVGRVFIILKRNGLISFINYKLMVPIINGLCKNEELTQELKTYEAHFREYVKRRVCKTSVYESGKFHFGEMACPAEGDALLILTDHSWSAERSLQEIMDLKVIVAEIFKINEFALDLQSVENYVPFVLIDTHKEDEKPFAVEHKAYFPVHLPGIEVLAEISVRVTSEEQSFEWEGYGLRLYIPPGSLPAGHTHCNIEIGAAVSGQFQFPEGSRPVSAVYWLSSDLEEFSKPLTLEIQHCARPSAVGELEVVTATTASPTLPFQFQCLKGGVFSPYTSYGSIQLNHFCLLCLIWNGLRSLFSCPPLTYCSHIYYTEKTERSCRAHVVITHDLETHILAVETELKKTAKQFIKDTSTRVKFCNDRIDLDMPASEREWKITPKNPPVILKEDVDSFEPGRTLNKCDLDVYWEGKGAEQRRLVLKIHLIGAEEPHNFLTLICGEEEGRSSTSGGPIHDQERPASFKESTPCTGKNTSEYKIINTNRSKITGVLESNSAASKTLKQKFKEKSWLKPTGDPDDDGLVTLILSRIEHDVSDFKEFIDMLSDIEGMDQIVDILTTSAAGQN